jgi:hypothetical protein
LNHPFGGYSGDRSDLLEEQGASQEEAGAHMTTTETLSGRAMAMLRAVDAGRAEFSGGREPDLYVDGLPCCDQSATHALVHAGLLRPSTPVALDERVRAELTEEGRAALSNMCSN